MFIDPGRNASTLERSFFGKPVKDDPIAIVALDEFSDDLDRKSVV